MRPIAVGDTLRRLVAKWLLATSQGRTATAALAPLQTAFAKGSPCEVVAMGVQAHVDALHGSTGLLLLQIDLKNAFNSIHRPSILGALEQRCPTMLPWVRQASQPAPLLVGREVIWSTREYSRATPLAPTSLRRASRRHWTPSPQGGHYTGGTWMMGSSWARWRRSMRCCAPSSGPCPCWN